MLSKNNDALERANPSAEQNVVIEFKPEEKKHRWGKIFGVIFLVVFLLVAISFGASAAYLKIYQGKVYPGVYLDHFHVGKMSAEDVNNFLEGLNNRLAKEGIVLLVKKTDGTEAQVKISTVLGGDDAIELVELKGLEASRFAMSAGRTGSWWQRLFSPLYYYLICNKEIAVPVVVNSGHLTESLKVALAPYADTPHDANIKILDSMTGQY